MDIIDNDTDDIKNYYEESMKQIDQKVKKTQKKNI